jgi:putative pyruvate formate lyase activating enzyme
MWEEPCISGEHGSGTIFFSGCNMRCVFCQNHNIADSSIGKEVTVKRLSEIMLELQAENAHNINLVTPDHYLIPIKEALLKAKSSGLNIPVVYNTSSYVKTSSLKSMKGLIDIYLPDFKYFDDNLADTYSNARGYKDIATEAIDEMLNQLGDPVFEDGLIKKGVIIRHMILPGHTKDSCKVLSHLHERYGNHVYISIMNQYTPLPHVENYPEINRKVTDREYNKVLNYAIDIGIINGFFQDGKTQECSFIPEFDYRGI